MHLIQVVKGILSLAAMLFNVKQQQNITNLGTATQRVAWEGGLSQIFSSLVFFILGIVKDMIAMTITLITNVLARKSDFTQKSQATLTPVTSTPCPTWLGDSELCAAIVRRDFDRARRILNAMPSLINVRHPLGWAPLHAAILSGDPTMVKFFLEKPSVDITVTDRSSFSPLSSAHDIRSRQEELCPHIPPTKCTGGATPLHFACMVGNWEIIRLLLDAGALHDVTDHAGRIPLEYFDTQRAGLPACKAYHKALTVWRTRVRALKPKDVSTLCQVIRDGDYSYCKQILDENPLLANSHCDSGWTALHVAAINRKSHIVDLLLSYPSCAINSRDRWRNSYALIHGSGFDHVRSSFASDEFNHRVLTGSTALHYACLTGDMNIVEKLLRGGASWEITDKNGFLPEYMIDCSRGDHLKREYRRLCKEEKERRIKQPVEETGHPLTEDQLWEEDPWRLIDTRSTKSGKKRRHKVSNGVSEAESEELRRYMKENPIEKIIGDKIIGQKGPIRSVSSAIRLRENGWIDPDRPLVMLFLGSSGVGKTELAKQITYYLQNRPGGDKSKSEGKVIDEIEASGAFVRIDMSEYQHSHTVANLTGSPKGYVGYDDGGSLADKLRHNPKAVVLLDEIEKAHPDVLTVFLQLFDDGRITSPREGVIYCKDALFIMTSNLASEEIRAASPILRALVTETENQHERYLQVIGKFNRKIYPILKKSLKRDEFLGRINQIIVFLPLDESEIGLIIDKELKQWRKRADEQHSIKLSWSSEVVARLVKSYDVNYGVRSVTNEIHRIAIQLLAEAHIRGDIGSNWLVHLCLNDVGDIDIEAAGPKGEDEYYHWRLLADHMPGIVVERRGCRYIL